MALVINCLDTAMDFVLAGAGAAKKGVAKVPDYAPSSEQGKNKMTYGYMTLALIVMLVRFTDFDISIVQALSSMCMFASFVLTTIKVAAQNSAAGISVRTLEMFAVALFVRLCSTLFMVGYLPDDLSGHQVFQFFDISSLAAVIRLLYVIHHEHRDTYDAENDLHGIAWCIPASFMLAFFVHPTLNRSLVFDTVYTAATVLDTFCMLPQLYMMMRQGGQVCDLLSRFVVLQFISRVCIVIFWADAWEELADGYYDTPGEINPGGANIPGKMFMGLAITQLLICADFMIYWVKAMLVGDAVTLPESV
jgi:ER lumen protein retaining receptor